MVDVFHRIDSEHLTRNITETLKDLYEHKQFSDITLISDDHIQIPAHKFILASCSNFFAKIFVNLSESTAALYLKGLKERDLDYLLQYCYLGQLTMPSESIDGFINIMEEFELLKDNVNHEKADDPTNGELNTLEERIRLLESENELLESKIDIIEKEEMKENIESIVTETDVKVDISKRDFNTDPVKPKFKKRGRKKMKRSLEEIRLRLQCDKCDYRATTHRSLQEHKKVKHLGIRNTVPCEICGKIFAKQAVLLTHIQNVHDKVILKCDVENCNYSVRTKMALNDHKKSVHEGREFFCDSCPKKFNKKSLLKNHQFAMHTDAPMIECGKCDYKTKIKYSFKRHTEGHEGRKAACDECNFKTTWTWNLNAHKRQVHKHPVHKCKICPFQSVNEATVENHVNTKHFQKAIENMGEQ